MGNDFSLFTFFTGINLDGIKELFELMTGTSLQG